MSGWSKLNLALLLLLVAVFTLNWSLQIDPTRRNFQVLPGMVSSVPFESFTANSVLPGGLTMQTPPAGTVPWRGQRLHYAATAEDAERAGRELENPFVTDDQRALERGRLVYETYCLLCHGASGAGDGSVAQRGFPTPASLLAANARQLPDGRIFHVVTHGQGNMPGHASQLAPDDRWKAALWVRQLQAEAGPLPAGELEATSANPATDATSVEEAGHEG